MLSNSVAGPAGRPGAREGSHDGLRFLPCTLQLLRSLRPFFRDNPRLAAEGSAGTIWMWRKEQEPLLCVYHDTLILQQLLNGYPAFTWPLGRDVDGALDALQAYVRSRELPLRFFALDEEQLHALLSDSRFPGAMWGFDRRWSDYVYDVRAIARMSGSALHNQRNMAGRFRREWPQAVFAPLEPEHLNQARELLRAYDAEHPDKDKLEAAEERHCLELLNAAHDLNLLALGVWVDGRLIGFTIGETVGQTLMEHVAKALRGYAGVYPAMLQVLASTALEQDGNLRYLNMEDDSGDAGLRWSKEHYHPLALVHKYTAHVRAPGAAISQLPVLREGKAVLTAFRDTDREAYLRLNTDRQNNLNWGYDYEEDYTVPSHLDENTFYDSVQFDMAVGDSINFAIRESPDGPMIGETLFWNFTDGGGAELGYRLLPEYQGRGLANGVVQAMGRYSRELGLRLHIRCRDVPGTLPSRKAAQNAGFRQTGVHDGWVWFEYTDNGSAPAPDGGKADRE